MALMLPEVHTEGHTPTSSGEYPDARPWFKKDQRSVEPLFVLCPITKELDRDEHRDRRQLAYEDVAF